MPDGVIFDMDGVLVQSARAHAASWKLLARKHGIEMSDAQFAESFGRTSREIIRTLWGDAIEDERIRALDAEKEATYRDLITGMIPLTIGVRETLWRLQQSGYALAIGTSGPPANVDIVLRETGMAGFFAAVVHGFDVARGKPAPDVFLEAARRAGLQPQRCVVVEDAPAGIEAARSAGMRPLGFSGTHSDERLVAAGATRVVSQMREITPEMIASILDAN